MCQVYNPFEHLTSERPASALQLDSPRSESVRSVASPRQRKVNDAILDLTRGLDKLGRCYPKRYPEGRKQMARAILHHPVL